MLEDGENIVIFLHQELVLGDTMRILLGTHTLNKVVLEDVLEDVVVAVVTADQTMEPNTEPNTELNTKHVIGILNQDVIHMVVTVVRVGAVATIVEHVTTQAHALTAQDVVPGTILTLGLVLVASM